MPKVFECPLQYLDRVAQKPQATVAFIAKQPREAFGNPRFWLGVAWQLLLVGGGAYGLGTIIGMGCR